ncbi:MAG: glycogen debranching protein [Pyrinomonadaceae bacterium]|nr:glycogen debranching protein [Pyrinomonadaceae bacterium]
MNQILSVNEFHEMMIELDKRICKDFERSSNREWLETNGIGGFASSTVSGANTRRYHGLLTAALRPPLGRVTTLSKFEEILTIGDESFELSANQYPGSVHPKGFEYLESFKLDPFPIWSYEINGIEITRSIFMVHGQNTTVCEWRVEPKIAGEISLELKPLLSFVDYHALQQETDEIDLEFEQLEGCVVTEPLGGEPKLYFDHNAAEIQNTGHWYRNFQYQVEKERGFDFSEDLFQPFSMKFDLSEPAAVVVSTMKHEISDVLALREREIARRNLIARTAGTEDDFTKQLVLAADQFIVSRGDGKTIIAGYPWFSDWGRDTMIALNGLTLATNRFEVAKNILLEFSVHISQGMIPNRFPDEGETPEYNTVDATLWYFEAIRAYAKETGNYNFVKDFLYEKLVEIVYWHERGTRFNIHTDSDGLLYAGEDGWQLTWMDAKLGDEVFTPRIGKPVEIQALWYNALRIMVDFAVRFEDEDGEYKYSEMAEKTRKSFNSAFWNHDEECLFDVINDDQKDPSVRPNQIFTVSLHHSMLSAFRAKKIVRKVEAELFTPFGLRSLAQGHPDYRPIYSGSPYERDSAYHQGTVWAWLMGPFIESLKKVYPRGRKSKQYINSILEGFNSHLSDEGLGQISEIFDGDAPHEARGCFAQAWSVAEILRVLKK